MRVVLIANVFMAVLFTVDFLAHKIHNESMDGRALCITYTVHILSVHLQFGMCVYGYACTVRMMINLQVQFQYGNVRMRG